jgi:hypothetical protein
LSLLLLVTAEFEMLASLKRKLGLGLADSAFETQHNLLGGLSFLVENLLGLTTITSLLTVVSTLSLGKQRSLSGLVLSYLVLGVLTTLPSLAISSSSLWDVDFWLVCRFHHI